MTMISVGTFGTVLKGLAKRQQQLDEKSRPSRQRTFLRSARIFERDLEKFTKLAVTQTSVKTTC